MTYGLNLNMPKLLNNSFFQFIVEDEVASFMG